MTIFSGIFDTALSPVTVCHNWMTPYVTIDVLAQKMREMFRTDVLRTIIKYWRCDVTFEVINTPPVTQRSARLPSPTGM